ncbi:hypothetical protein ACIGW4_04780 [Streptomyces sp. NPDC053513]|uniref:hypothetical protein n=1 Tax=unclassified Streptomyces TaxID=2593676 RepID=UPI000F494542|nr:hypothetical protein [Streptomyces sp. PanSC19]
MGAEHDPELLEEALRVMGGSWAELPRVRRSAEAATDVSEMTESALQVCLAEALGDLPSTLIAVWPADRVAAGLTSEELITAIDDLWYPSMDDLVVISTAGDHTTVLVLDHEEQLTVTRLPR